MATRVRAELRAIYEERDGTLHIANVVAGTVGVPRFGMHFRLPGRWFGRLLNPSFKISLDVRIDGLKIGHNGNQPTASGVLVYTITIDGIFIDRALNARQSFQITGRDLTLGEVNFSFEE